MTSILRSSKLRHGESDDPDPPHLGAADPDVDGYPITYADRFNAPDDCSNRDKLAGLRSQQTIVSRKTLLDAALALCTVGGVVFAIGASKEPVSKVVVLPDTAFLTLMVVGGALIAGGLIAFLFSLLIEQIGQVVERVTYGDVDSKYLCTHAGLGDLPGLHALYARYFGADVPDVQLMGEWVAKCASAFTIVQKVVEEGGLLTRQNLVGSFKLLPLTAKGVRAIELGQVTGSTFRSEHISSGRPRPAGYYVGDVVATTRFARGVVMAQLNAAVLPAVRGAVTVYARPLTKDGLRVMTKHGFVQVSDGRSAPVVGRVCKLQVGSEAVVRRRARRPRLVPVSMTVNAA